MSYHPNYYANRYFLEGATTEVRLDALREDAWLIEFLGSNTFMAPIKLNA